MVQLGAHKCHYSKLPNGTSITYSTSHSKTDSTFYILTKVSTDVLTVSSLSAGHEFLTALLLTRFTHRVPP